MSAPRGTTRSALCFDCGSVTTDGTRHCPTCRRALSQEVRDSTDLLGELDLTLSRQGRSGDNGGRPSTETPVAFRIDASRVIVELRTSIRALAKAAPNIDLTMVRRFRDARREAWRVVDIADGRVFIGVCDCSNDDPIPLYAPRDADSATCRHCRQEWPAEAPDAWEHLQKAVGPLSEIRKWMLVLGYDRSKTQLARDIVHVDPVGGSAGARLYCLTDVLEASYRAGARSTA